MTSALGNTAGGTPFATGADAFVYPQMIWDPLRAPNTTDFYNPGTRWQDNSVNPAVQYYTIGMGIWYRYSNSISLLDTLSDNANTIVLPSSSNNIQFTSTAGTIQVVSNPGNHSINLDITGGFNAIEKINLDTGTTPITPTAGAITLTAGTVLAGTHPIRTDGTGTSTAKIEVQFTQATASTDPTKVGLAAFNSADFSVDANGFVQTNGRTLKWLVINQATQPANFAVNTGYICQAGGTGLVSIALPATSALGDLIEIVLDGATRWTITQGAGQQIRVAGTQTTSGATGTIVTTGTGDSISLVCETANLRWVSRGFQGNLTVT